ncbi:CPBP family intramembrane glutamic endopeptidase [Sphingomonas endolithica]|uniref:CPBP family intramembrane glutamic endopeptidase n=1 Tax=Sphingomonas endolithica TaxID=2972485 RepID=UPI0021AE7CA1|nr:CPBP family intramembrane glutamic endopeptidase [Sphingomonas sp. ZFBP2030]
MSKAVATAWAAAGVAVATILIAFGPMLVETVISTGGSLGPMGIETVFTAAIFGAMLLVAIGGGAVTGISPLAGGERPAAMLALGAAIGLSGLLAASALAWIAGGLVPAGGAPSVGGAILLGLLTVTLQVIAEEAYFRGWLQPLVVRVWGQRLAVPVVAAGFAALHVLGGARDPLALANLFLGGLVFGLLAARAGGIAPAVGMHLGWNGAEQLLLGLEPNPGVSSFGSILDLDLVGSALWGGSTEGLNASMAMMVALLAIFAPLVISRRRPR